MCGGCRSPGAARWRGITGRVPTGRLAFAARAAQVSAMTVHLLKLAVGAASVAHLEAFVARQAEAAAAAGERPAARITTRMAPKRAEEVLDGGSLYWVVKGVIAARQRVLAIEPFTDGAGTGRVHIVLAPEVTGVRPRPCRPFQGWRYLRAEDAPADLSADAVDEAMPETMRRELMELCLI